MKKALFALILGTATISIAQSDDDWKFSGYLDVYYQFDFGNPPSGDTVNGRGFDIAHKQLKLAVGELDAMLAPTKERPWGVNIQLYAGKNADLIHLAEPGGMNKYKFMRQAYVSYAAPTFTVDFGKFDTWIGYEGVDNRGQDQYSRSFNWTYSEPTYAAGLRITGKLSDKVSGALFVVNGWNEVEDGNNSPSIGAQLTFASDPKTSIVLQNSYGDEGSDDANDVGSYGGIGFSNPGTSKVHLIDVIVSHQLTDKTKVAFNADFVNSNGGANDGRWNGQVIYLRHQLSEKQALGFRIEQFEDTDGIRTGISNLRLNSCTGGFDLTINKNATLRFEARHDISNTPFFNSDDGLKKYRTTLTLAGVLKL